jgi:hypothetical protein
MAQAGGLKLDTQTTEALSRAQMRESRRTRIALWIGAAALAILALSQIL